MRLEADNESCEANAVCEAFASDVFEVDDDDKALIEALIAEIKITAADRLIPVFRVPQPPSEETTLNAEPAG